jgi:hypothetical protein
MLGERALSDTHKLRLPADLLAELQRQGPRPKNDFRVHGWKPSLFARLLSWFKKG